ncbi:PIR protein [Plasmodium vivax]|nr:PIR protein [Plasmodium vivax]
MTDDILDIAKWKIEYPFLSNVSEVYDKFNNNDYGDTGRNSYDALCDSIIKFANDNVEEYKDICMKLMRNLEYFSSVSKFYQRTSERCNMLYNWVYNIKDENKITENIANKCFDEYTDHIKAIGHEPNCSKLSYEDVFEEPKKMTLLHIFEFNMKIIKDILNDKSYPDEIPLRKFICECVKIYKYMNDTYCPKRESNKKHESTCLKLNQFKESYKLFRSNNGLIIPNIPSLDNIDNECFEKNSPGDPNTLLSLNRHGTRGHVVGEGLAEFSAGLDNSLGVNYPTRIEGTDSPMKKTISTTVGTVAGATSLLALLYKFSPGGNWIRSGIRGSRGRIYSNLYAEGPNELFDGMEHNGFNSYSIGYEAM